MKKVISLLLAAMLVLSLAACGAKDRADDKKPAVPDQSSSQTPVDVSEPSTTDGDAGNTPEVIDNPVEDENPGVDLVVKPGDFDEPVVVVDNEDYCWKFIGIDESPYDDFSLSVYVENKTADKSLMFTTQGFTINGVFDQDGFAWMLEPGESDTVKWGLHDYMHADVDLGPYTEIAGNWLVGEKDTWIESPLETGEFRVCPFGEENVISYERKTTKSDIVLVDNNDVAVTLVEYTTDEDNGNFKALIYIENRTGKPIRLMTDNEAVNGEAIMALFAHEIRYGSRSVAYIQWEKEKLDAAGITDTIESIDFTLEVRDSDDFSTVYAEESISLKPGYTWGS